MANLYNPNSPLEEIVVQDIESLLAKPGKFASLFTKGKPTKVNSRGLRVPFDKQRNASIGYVDPRGGAFVPTDTTSYNHFTIQWQMIQVGAEIDYESILDSDNGSLVDAVDAALAKKADALSDWIECFACIGDGTPTIATVTAITTAGTTITCSGANDGFGAYWIRERMYIDVWDSTMTTKKYASIKVTAKTSNTAAFTVNTTVTVAVGDRICITTPTGVTTGIKGIDYICQTSGAYFDKNKSDLFLRPNADAVSAALSAQKMQRLYAGMEYRWGEEQDNVLIACGFAQKSAYYDIIKPEGSSYAARINYNYNGTSRPKGDAGLADMDYTWFGKPIKGYVGLKPNAMYFLLPDKLKKTEIKSAGAIKGMPQVQELLPKIDGNGAYNFATQTFSDAGFELYSNNPGKLGVISALDTTSLPLPKDSNMI